MYGKLTTSKLLTKQENSYLIGRYFSAHLTTNIDDVKLSINVVNGRNGLRPLTRI